MEPPGRRACRLREGAVLARTAMAAFAKRLPGAGDPGLLSCGGPARDAAASR
jgi:hypothetical protein